MVFQRSMVDWRRELGSIWHRYMCIVLYMKLMWCNGFPKIYEQLQLQLLLIWRRGWGQSGMGICALYYI